MPSRLFALSGAVLLSFLGVSAESLHAQSDVVAVTDAMLQSPPADDWLMWRRTLDGWGYSPLDQIDRSNVARPRLWSGRAGLPTAVIRARLWSTTALCTCQTRVIVSRRSMRSRVICAGSISGPYRRISD